MKTKRQRFWGGLAIVLLVLILGYLAIRPVHLRWGATDEDVSRALPGDLDGRRWTRAITIAATPEEIWPWLVQWGQGRGGWYSYDWLENLLGFDIHTADRILPEHQNPRIGDPICMAANSCTSFVSIIEPHQWFGWHAKDPAGKPVWNFIFGLFPVDAGRTRLVLRESFDPAAMPAAVVALIELPDVIMEQKALDTVRQRAEGRPASAFTTIYEIAVWLAAFVIGVVAAGLFIRGRDWQRFLLLGIASIIVLLVLTFLYPPLWLRGLLVLGLLALCIYWFNQTRGKR